MKDFYINLGFELRELQVAPESKAYAACTFELGEHKVVGRRAKITQQNRAICHVMETPERRADSTL
jgi:hypothetical protein